MLKRVFRLTLRVAQGFIDAIFALMKRPLRCPDYSCVSRRVTGFMPTQCNVFKGFFWCAGCFLCDTLLGWIDILREEFTDAVTLLSGISQRNIGIGS